MATESKLMRGARIQLRGHFIALVTPESPRPSRCRVREIPVVCPPSMLFQWKDETL